MTKYTAAVSAYGTMTGRFPVEAETPEKAAELAAKMLQGPVDPQWEYIDGGRPAPGSEAVDEIRDENDEDVILVVPSAAAEADHPAVTGSDAFRSLVERAIDDWPEFDTEKHIYGETMVEWLRGFRSLCQKAIADAAKSTESTESTLPDSIPEGHFRVQRLKDAYIIYEADVQATTAQEAWDIAHAGDVKLKWVPSGESEFDASLLGVIDDDRNYIIEPGEE